MKVWRYRSEVHVSDRTLSRKVQAATVLPRGSAGATASVEVHDEGALQLAFTGLMSNGASLYVTICSSRFHNAFGIFTAAYLIFNLQAVIVLLSWPLIVLKVYVQFHLFRFTKQSLKGFCMTEDGGTGWRSSTMQLRICFGNTTTVYKGVCVCKICNGCVWWWCWRLLAPVTSVSPAGPIFAWNWPVEWRSIDFSR